MAQNEAVGEFTNMGIGMGMIGGVGAPVAGMVGSVMGDAVGSVGAAVVQTTPQQQGASDPVSVLRQLKELLDAGLIPQETYDSKMNEVLSRM